MVWTMLRYDNLFEHKDDQLGGVVLGNLFIQTYVDVMVMVHVDVMVMVQSDTGRATSLLDGARCLRHASTGPASMRGVHELC